MGLLDRLLGRGADGDADGGDPSTARARDELLQEREEDLQREIGRLRSDLEAMERQTVEAHAAGDAEEAADGRERRIRIRAELDDAEAALEAVRDTREELRPDVLREEARDQVREAEEALEEAREGCEELAQAADRLLRERVVPLAEAYRRALEAAKAATEIERELQNEHGRELEVSTPSSMDRQLRREFPNGWRAWQALASYHEQRRD